MPKAEDSKENVILKKTLAHQSLEFKNGELSVWGIPTVLFPMNTYLLFEKSMMERFGPDAKDIIYYLQKKQAYGGMAVLQKQFGYKDIKQVISFQLETGALMGVGVVTLTRFDSDAKVAHVKIFPNPLANLYLKLFGLSQKPVDIFTRGGMAGIFSYAFNEDMVAIETQCLAMGKPFCIIEVRPRDSWDAANSFVKEQMPKEEKEYSSFLEKLTAQTLRK
jgi:hypothetical protein